MKVALVDDEPLARDYLERILSGLPGLEVIATYKNGREAIAGLQREPVDVAFLDVEMPGLTGIDVIKSLQSDVMPLVVFATAHSEFAVDAFELHAVDYILKPFAEERVVQALDRCRQRLESRRNLDDAEQAADRSRGKGAALAALGSSGGRGRDATAVVRSTDVGKLAIKDGQQTVLVTVNDIDWVDAAGDYMCVHAAGATHILRSTMKELVERLPETFVRIHRSTIVNLTKVEAVEGLPKGEAQLSISGGGRLKVSRNFRKAIQNLLS